MPPKTPAPILRCPISDSSLVFVPADALEGYQERIETGIDWTLSEEALRNHRKHCIDNEDLPTVTFSDAFNNKLSKSFLGKFLDKTSTISLQDQWDVVLSLKLWDNEKFANDEGKLCFEDANSITDHVLSMIKEAVRLNDREILQKKFKQVDLLRVNNGKMTDLDSSILKFKYLVSLSLCGNYIKNLNGNLIPPTLRILELQTNFISNIDSFVDLLPTDLLYLGLAKNLLSSGTIGGLSRLPYNISVLDISENNIYDLVPVLEALVHLPNLISLYMIGNPCSVCNGYARFTLMTLQRLKWLDAREIHPTDRPTDVTEVHPDDLRSTFFNFNVLRIMGVPQPPKTEKGISAAFHVELEIPLLDGVRRQFLIMRRYESLTEMLPIPEDEEQEHLNLPASSMAQSKNVVVKDLEEASEPEFNIYDHPETKNPWIVNNFTTFESNKIQWNKIMNFVEPTVKIFCPDLVALRNTFKSIITIKLVYTMVAPKTAKIDKRSTYTLKTPGEQRVVLATIRCALKIPDWTQHSQYFHWDDTLNTNDAIHWGDGDLSILQYSLLPIKVPKGKTDTDTMASSRQNTPENFTCHFGFSIDTLRG